ncbi:50S ribosomal protein L19 [Rodentibacter sp. Ppn85]|uniref:50S ribosomal protein L19 n=1 Tax=Rodentibacter sp. Ppn85 TaxID=1908525 RepID=UPI0021009D5F|nr:50S ribosomal protein L19 [Rodentibacter sp. Ppn85]
MDWALCSKLTKQKLIQNLGAECIFQACCPIIDSIVVKRNGLVYKAKFYYLG